MKIIPNSKIIFEIRRGRRSHGDELQEELDKRGINIKVEKVFGEQYKNYVGLPVDLKPKELYKYVKIIDNMVFK